jgi:electron transport complex protein RnfE
MEEKTTKKPTSIAGKIIKNGIIDENPTFRLVLGMCPTLAVTTAVVNALGMGAAATFVLICSNVVISALRNFIPDKVRIPAFVVIIAAFVTIVQLIMKAFLPDLDKALGIFIPLIVVNCIILGRAEAFASKNQVFPAFLDGLGMGIGFTLALTIIATVREILGSGTFFGIPLFGEAFPSVLIFIMAPGGFITLGLLLGLINKLTAKKKKQA